MTRLSCLNGSSKSCWYNPSWSRHTMKSIRKTENALRRKKSGATTTRSCQRNVSNTVRYSGSTRSWVIENSTNKWDINLDWETHLTGCSSWGRLYGVQTGSPTNSLIACHEYNNTGFQSSIGLDNFKHWISYLIHICSHCFLEWGYW